MDYRGYSINVTFNERSGEPDCQARYVIYRDGDAHRKPALAGTIIGVFTDSKEAERLARERAIEWIDAQPAI